MAEPVKEIRSRRDGKPLYTADETKQPRELLEEAVKARANLAGANLARANLAGANLDGANLARANLDGAYLTGAYLAGANLAGANLAGAYLDGAYLAGANLDGANLAGAYLAGAYLAGANLARANLDGAKINWQSHALISEILWRAAGDNVQRQMAAAWVGRKWDWCWSSFLAFEHEDKAWALAELRKWVQPGDNAPKALLAETQEQPC